jgi:hypothetical protein
MVWKNWLRNYILSLRPGLSGDPASCVFPVLTAQKAGLGFSYGIKNEVVWNGLVLLE